MKTITFDGATQEEAENKKEEWLSANKGLTVIAVRKFPLTKIPNHPYVPVEYAVSIELDYEGEMPERIHSVSPRLTGSMCGGAGFSIHRRQVRPEERYFYESRTQ
ncbi:MAG TPA: hypothetical protein VF011_04250 [Terriglobales bacterium]